MKRQFGLVFLLVLLLIGSAGGQSSAYYTRDGVEYYMAVGTMTSGNLTNGMDFGFEDRIPFEGCAVAKLRPDKSLGRVRIIGMLGQAPMDLEWSQFTQDHGAGILEDVDVDGSRVHGTIQHPRVAANVAAWGHSNMRIWTDPFTDPASDSETFQTSMFVTQQGFRQEGKVFNSDGAQYVPGDQGDLEKDWEMQIRVQSPGGIAPPSIVMPVERPTSAAPPAPNYFPPSDYYSETFAFTNTYYGGIGRVTVDAEAINQDGENRLNFSIRGPDGNIRKSFELAPSIGSSPSADIDFELDQFGIWSVEIDGEVSLSRFDMQISQEPPADFDLNFFWEDVQFGSYALEALQICEAKLGHNADIVESVVERSPPPPYRYTPIVAAIVGVIAMILTAAAFTVMTMGIIKHHRMANK